ncbi:hypothetical protein ABTE11_22870, partial [Acinetobacter baumannii]
PQDGRTARQDNKGIGCAGAGSNSGAIDQQHGIATHHRARGKTAHSGLRGDTDKNRSSRAMSKESIEDVVKKSLEKYFRDLGE